jgi:hypothetical protein
MTTLRGVSPEDEVSAAMSLSSYRLPHIRRSAGA